MKECGARHRFRYSFFAGLLLLGFLCSGQTPDTAIIVGTVCDQSGALVSGALITVSNALSKVTRVTRSDASGFFSLSGLPVDGSYSIEAAKQGFAPASQEGLVLAGGITVSISLKLNVLGQETAIVVTGTAGGVRTDAPQIGQYVGDQQASEMPLLNRRITYLPLLNAANRPAINQGDVFMNENLFTTNGAGRRQTWFEVDGATGNDSWGRQTIFSNVPLLALQEMTILENAFSAEFGGSTGSAINIVTRSGSGDFHGDLLTQIRPAATAAALSGFTAGTAGNGNDLTSDRMNQGGLTFSGPLGKATQFFMAGEYTSEDRVSPITSPIAPGSFVGEYRGWLGLIRLDRHINTRNSIFIKSNADGFRDTNPNGIVGREFAAFRGAHIFAADLHRGSWRNVNDHAKAGQ